jgi:hypothetical protein
MLLFAPQDVFQAAKLPTLHRRLKCSARSGSAFPLLILRARLRRARIRAAFRRGKQ